jgi:hypothetical protein
MTASYLPEFMSRMSFGHRDHREHRGNPVEQEETEITERITL